MGIKYKIYRLRVKIKHSNKKSLDYLDDVQKKAYDITVQMINDKDGELMHDPINGRMGIRKGDIFVEIASKKIRIYNNISHDDILVDDRIRESLAVKFKEKMTRKFNAIENQFIDRAKNRLDTIKEEISNK